HRLARHVMQFRIWAGCALNLGLQRRVGKAAESDDRATAERAIRILKESLQERNAGWIPGLTEGSDGGDLDVPVGMSKTALNQFGLHRPSGLTAGEDRGNQAGARIGRV